MIKTVFLIQTGGIMLTAQSMGYECIDTQKLVQIEKSLKVVVCLVQCCITAHVNENVIHLNQSI